MNALFMLLHCPFCNLVSECVLNINKSLPIGQQIQFIDIFSGHPFLKFLEALYQSPDPYEWAVPILVIDNPVVQEMFNSIVKGYRERFVLKTIWEQDHYITLLRRIIK